jgi:hypothetical protein
MADYWHSVRRMVSGNSGNAVPRKRSLYEPAPDDLQILISGETPSEGENLEEISGAVVQDHSRNAPQADQLKSTYTSADLARTGKFAESLEKDGNTVEQIEFVERRDTPVQAPPPVEGSNAPTAKLVDSPGDIQQAESLPFTDQVDVPVSHDNASEVTQEPLFAADESRYPDVALPGATESEPKDQAEDAGIAAVEVQIARIHSEIEEVVDAVPVALSEPPQEHLEPAPPQPLLIEIGQVEITIARPEPPAQTRFPAPEPSKPVIALDAYLAQSDKRQS